MRPRWSSCSRSPRDAGCTASRSWTRCGPTCRSRPRRPRLHKAAHYARRALGDGTAGLALRNDLVMLFPDADVRVDAVEFRRVARGGGGLRLREPRRSGRWRLYAGPFLPDDLYEPWASPWREALGVLHQDLLRLAGHWEELRAAWTRADEEAHLALAREHADRGDVRAALRQLERMEQALRRELGTAPSAAAVALRSRLSGSIEQPEAGARRGPRLDAAGRAGAAWRTTIRERMDRADAGSGSTVVLTGVGRGREVGGARPVRRAGPAPRLAGRPGRGVGGRGLVALRAGAGGLRGPVPPPSRAARRPRRHVRRRARPGAGRPADHLGRGDRPPAAVRGGRRAAAARRPPGAGCCWSWTTCTRPTRRRCGCCTTWPAARSPSTVVDPRRRPPRHRCGRCGRCRRAWWRGGSARSSSSRRSTSGATRRLLEQRFPDLDERDGRGDLGGLGGAAVPGAGGGARRAAAAARGRGGVRTAAATRWRCSAGSRCWARRSPPTSCSPSPGADEPETYAAPRGRARHRGRRAGRGRLPVPPRAGAGVAAVRASRRTSASRAGREVAERLADLDTPPARVAHLFVAVGPPGAGASVRPAGDRDGRRARRLPGRAGAARRRRRPRLGSRPGAPARAARRPADGAGGPVGGRRLPRRAVGHQRDRAPAGPRAGWRGPRRTRATSRPPSPRSANLEAEGDIADAPLLLARGSLAYFTGDVEAAWEAADEARSLLQPGDTVAGHRPRRAAGPDRAPAWRVVPALPARAAAYAGQPRARRPRCSTPICAWRSTCSTGRSRTTR